jgi:hypothetical protein
MLRVGIEAGLVVAAFFAGGKYKGWLVGKAIEAERKASGFVSSEFHSLLDRLKKKL